MEGIIVALISGGMTLVGVLIANGRNHLCYIIIKTENLQAFYCI